MYEFLDENKRTGYFKNNWNGSSTIKKSQKNGRSYSKLLNYTNTLAVRGEDGPNKRVLRPNKTCGLVPEDDDPKLHCSDSPVD